LGHHHHHDDEDTDAQKRAQQSLRDKESKGRFAFPDGITTEFRLLKTPGDKERKSPPTFLEYMQHTNVGPNKRMARCGCRPGENDIRKCWLHRKSQSLKDKGRTSEAAKLTPKKFIAVQVAVRDRDSGDMVGPLLLTANSGIKATALGPKLLSIVCHTKMSRLLDPKRGYNYKMKRKGQGINTDYGELKRDDEPSRVPKEIIQRLQPFADLPLPEYSEEWQKAAYYGTEGDNKDMAAKGKKKSRKRDASDSSSSDASASESDASSSDASSSDASSSSSDASSSDASSSDASDKDTKKKKGKSKKGKKKDSSSSDASSSDASSSDASDASSSDASDSSDASSSSSDASSSDGSDASSSSSDASDASDASSSDASSSDADEKPKRGRKPKAKPKAKRGPKAKKRKK
jgi:hypothetical protein